MATARFQFFTRRLATAEWRLISSNNWELGRCAVPLVDLDACVAEVMRLRDAVDRAVEDVVPDAAGGWRWRLAVDGQPVAISSRSFLRRVECESTLAQFRKMAATAPAVPRLRVFC